MIVDVLNAPVSCIVAVDAQFFFKDSGNVMVQAAGTSKE